MRLVEERSLSPILRSNLLTTLINNDVSGKVNPSRCANALDNFHGMQTSFASEAIGLEVSVTNHGYAGLST